MDFTNVEKLSCTSSAIVKAVDIMLKMQIVDDRRGHQPVSKESFSSAASVLTKNVEIDALN